MTKRPLAIFLLLVAFLLSAWGNVIGAAFCPRYLAQNCHIKSAAKQIQQVDHESCHEMAGMSMDNMNMDDMQMEKDSAAEVSNFSENLQPKVATDASVDQSALDLPNEPCGHCWMHSQPPSGTATLAAVDPSPRSFQTIAPVAEIAITLPFQSLIATEPLEHGPPGTASPRHVLINVFRI